MKCDYCDEKAVFRLYHRDLSETVRCVECKNPDTVCSIAKLGLEFKDDNWFHARIEDKK